MKKTFKRIYVEITNKCNLSCSFCPKTNRPLLSMTNEQFEYIINDIKNYTDYIYLHVKGEPLFHENLQDILSICNDNNLNVNITTNGTLLSENVEILTKYPVRQISISLHSLDANIGIDFESYLENIISSYRILHEKANTIISFRLWNLNKYNMNEDQRKRNEFILNYIEQSFNLEYKIETILSDNKGIKLCDRIFLNIDYEFEWPSLNNNYYNDNGYCYGLKNQLAILCDGTVVPCCLDGDGIINLGNIFDNNLQKILSSQRSKNIIEGFNSRKAKEELCAHCSYKARFVK